MNQLKSLQENRIYFLMIPAPPHANRFPFPQGMFSHWKIYFLKRLSYLFEKLQCHGLHAAGPFIDSTCSSCSLKGRRLWENDFRGILLPHQRKTCPWILIGSKASRSATWRLIELQSATVPRKRIFQYLNNMNIWKNMKADRNPISNGLSLEINFTKSQISLEFLTFWPRPSRLMLPPFKLSRLVLNLEDGLHNYHSLLVILLMFYFLSYSLFQSPDDLYWIIALNSLTGQLINCSFVLCTITLLVSQFLVS